MAERRSASEEYILKADTEREKRGCSVQDVIACETCET